MRYKQNNSNKVFLRINNAANWGRIILGVLTGGVSEVGIGIAQSSKGVKMSGQPADDDDELQDDGLADQQTIADSTDKDVEETSYTKYIVLGVLFVVLIIVLVLNKKKKL